MKMKLKKIAKVSPSFSPDALSFHNMFPIISRFPFSSQTSSSDSTLWFCFTTPNLLSCANESCPLNDNSLTANPPVELLSPSAAGKGMLLGSFQVSTFDHPLVKCGLV
jgi:hypothetical protein